MGLPCLLSIQPSRLRFALPLQRDYVPTRTDPRPAFLRSRLVLQSSRELCTTRFAHSHCRSDRSTRFQRSCAVHVHDEGWGRSTLLWLVTISMIVSVALQPCEWRPRPFVSSTKLKRVGRGVQRRRRTLLLREEGDGTPRWCGGKSCCLRAARG
ncbi:hypothetical protein EXIGLDRAFT_120592 [Exidia glandulosa HHB12029]|uniref:Uncharacterized protein n=1 Tax=Exidia glandulosa HHB12029 TaxID=1314781 RepID=A0A165GEW8_EXIGL|nr:hypothetical protein EXIGLDRAFT_120592 [Exidia glandulosa HHB12029]